ncbi:MAG TPA: hypothetical protein VFF65_10305, partial [Phycisphaerales bacterium]|nr:hypothetical protein [Phycisphaerales bacterium]
MTMGVWTMAGRWAAVTAVAACVLAGGASVRADEPLDQANALYSTIQTDKRSDLIILPVLHEMEPPPGVPGDFLAAFLMTTQSPGWEEAVAWAKGEKQQAVLKALSTVTKEEDARKAFAFAQPYGAAAVDPKFVDWKLYTELGEDNTLASAQFLYLTAVRKMELLCHVDATRLLAEGKGNEAL